MILINFLGSLEESLWFLHKYIKDAAEKEESLDEILIPMLENVWSFIGNLKLKVIIVLDQLSFGSKLYFYYLINLCIRMFQSTLQKLFWVCLEPSSTFDLKCC